MAEKNNASFIRWQGRTIKQFGFVNNLLITLALSFLVFQTRYFFDENTVQPLDILLILLGISSVSMFASLIVGGFLAMNRLLSFRYTAQIARKRETGQRDNIKELRDWTNELDTRTWRLLWWQVGLFAHGSLFLFLVIIFGIFLSLSL